MTAEISNANGRAIISIASFMVALLGFGSVASLAGAQGPLPDSRAYEQVSPVDKDGSDLEPGPAMAAIDGNRLFFVSRGSFAGQPTSLAAENTPYLSTRSSSGWRTEGIALPNGLLSFGSDGYQGFTADLSKGLIAWNERTRFGPHDPAAQLGFNQYIRDSETGSYQLVNGTAAAVSNTTGFVWGSADFGMVALSANAPLTGDCASGELCAYESIGGAVRLASVLPGGEAVKGAVGNAGPGENPFLCNFEHAVSDDGSRLFFTSLEGEHKLYVRENGTSTSLISASERTLPGGATGNGVNYQSAEATHGDRVLFTTRNSLVDADTNATNDLYMYDFTKPAGERLTLISADQDPEAPEGAAVNAGLENCGGLVGASEDLRRVYFVANNQIVPGAPEGEGPKLYLWQETGSSPEVAYIGTLNASTSPDSSYLHGDGRIWASPAVDIRTNGIPRQARWSRDGRYLAFISSASLTGFEDEGEEEVYRYDAVSGSLECLTCVADALPSHGEVSFETSGASIRPVNHMPSNVSDSGQVFFQTTKGLVPGDSNGQQDVYEYDGQLHLISSGSGNDSSSLLDATPSGSDVFFTTRDRLVGWDTDGNLDAYDARVGGGFPEPAFVPPACEGEACLPAAVGPNDPTPASSSFQGAGNVTEAPSAGRCAKGKVKRHGRCLKKKRHAKKQQARHGKNSTRSHG